MDNVVFGNISDELSHLFVDADGGTASAAYRVSGPDQARAVACRVRALRSRGEHYRIFHYSSELSDNQFS
jgi:hypothetical protein